MSRCGFHEFRGVEPMNIPEFLSYYANESDKVANCSVYSNVAMKERRLSLLFARRVSLARRASRITEGYYHTRSQYRNKSQ